MHVMQGQDNGVGGTGGGALQLRAPYLLFLGEEVLQVKAKTAFGLRDWAGDKCLAQHRLPAGSIDLGLPWMTPQQAAAAGAKSLVIGVTPPGGVIQPSWHALLFEAVAAGLDLVSGLHGRLDAVPGLADAAASAGTALIDVRRPPAQLPRATGKRRSGKRLLTVGTDCAVGKKYTALALAQAMQAQGIDAQFRASGQTGVMIAGSGIAMDAVVSDFLAGAAECLSPAAAPTHWDVIEGQGGLLHPAYAAVTLGLLHGSQPDVLVLCHDAARSHLVSWPDYPVPTLEDAAALYLRMARLTNPEARLGAISLNTSALDDAQAQQLLSDVQARLQVPCFDPLRGPLDAVVARIVAA